MQKIEEVILSLDEKNTILDKIIEFQKNGKLENIQPLVKSGITHYTAGFVDKNGTAIAFSCSHFHSSSPQHGRHGMNLVDIVIYWNQSFAYFTSGGGDVEKKIKELIAYLKPICDEQGRKTKGSLLS